jgi:hydrogenase maturation protease
MADRKKKAVLILGVGNVLLKDEGLGVQAAEVFSDRYTTSGNVTCMDGGTGGIKLLPLLKDITHLIIVDAIDSEGPPGSIYRFPPKNIAKGAEFMSTTHQIGIKELLLLAAFEGYSPEVTLIGMIPGDMSHGLDLSPAVKEKLPLMVELIKDELGGLGIKTELRRPDA